MAEMVSGQPAADGTKLARKFAHNVNELTAHFQETMMRKLLAVAICSLPLAWIPTVFAQSGGSTNTGASTSAGTSSATGNDTRTSPAGTGSVPQGTTSTEATSGGTAKTVMEGNPAGTDAKEGNKGAASGADNRSTAERVGGVPDKAAGSPQRGDTRTGSTSDTTKP